MPKEIVAKFAHSLEQFEPIAGQPSDSNLTRIREVIAPLIIQIPYDETGAVHNLIGLIRPKAAYIMRCGATFPESTRVGAYDASIDNDATAVVRAHTESAHKAKRADRATYKTARRETAQFILAAVDDTWVREIRDTETLYTNVAPKDLLSHLQAVCTGRHDLDLMMLHNKMQRYHLEVEGIPEYINMIEDAQKKAGRAGRTIADKTLLIFVENAMLTRERLPQTNNDWEDRDEADKTQDDWKEVYKKAHAKVRVKAQANEGSVKFGAANSEARLETTQGAETNKGVDEGGMKSLDGYFDNLAAATVNKKSVLKQLVANNNKVAATNKNLVAIVKKLTNDINYLERETSCLKKTGGQGNRDLTLFPHYKKEGYHAAEACLELVRNKYKHPTCWKSFLSRRGTVSIISNIS